MTSDKIKEFKSGISTQTYFVHCIKLWLWLPFWWSHMEGELLYLWNVLLQISVAVTVQLLCSYLACTIRQHKGMRDTNLRSKGSIIFFGRGVPNLQKVSINKIVTPILGIKILWPPHHRYTLPPKQAKIVLKSVFLNKINTLSVVILWLPTFWSSKIL